MYKYIFCFLPLFSTLFLPLFVQGQESRSSVVYGTQWNIARMEEIAKVANPINAKRPDYDLTRTILRYDVNANIADTIHVTESPVARMSFPSTMDKIMLELVGGYGGSSVIRPRSWRIIDTSGVILLETDINIKSFSFSPDGSRIAFIMGTDAPETDRGFYPDSLGILDIADGSIKWIVTNTAITEKHHESIRDPYLWMRKVLWSSAGGIYVVSIHYLYSLDTLTGTLLQSSIPGQRDEVGEFSISPDGKYFFETSFSDNEFGRGVGVYNLNTEQPAGALIDSALGRQISARFYEYDTKWFGPDGARLIVQTRPRYKRRSEMTEAELRGSPQKIKLIDEPERLVIIDFNLGKVIYEETPPKTNFFSTSPWQAWSGSLLVERDGRLMEFPLSELQLGDKKD